MLSRLHSLHNVKLDSVMLKSLYAFLFLPFSLLSPAKRTNVGLYQFHIEKGAFEKEHGQTYWVIPTTLTNHSNDTLKYYSMSCSWQDFYSVDNRKLQVETSICSKNMPVVLQLAPHQSKTTSLRLIIPQTLDATVIRFKIGFNLIKPQANDAFVSNLRKKKENVLWSNTVAM
jgi:hypothetical protein